MENIKSNKCAPVKDGHLRRTCVIDTEKTAVGSKNRILGVKMLKIQKKRQRRQFLRLFSGKITLKHLTYS